MTQDQIEGTVRNVAGKVQNAVGGLTGDTGEQLEGKAREVAGKVQANYGEALDQIRDQATDKPLQSLLIAVGVGVLIGRLLSPRN